jgi:hypothetical protein
LLLNPVTDFSVFCQDRLQIRENRETEQNKVEKVWN